MDAKVHAQASSATPRRVHSIHIDYHGEVKGSCTQSCAAGGSRRHATPNVATRRRIAFVLPLRSPCSVFGRFRGVYGLLFAYKGYWYHRALPAEAAGSVVAATVICRRTLGRGRTARAARVSPVDTILCAVHMCLIGSRAATCARWVPVAYRQLTSLACPPAESHGAQPDQEGAQERHQEAEEAEVLLP